MAYQRIRQPKLSDVIEQELERLIVEGTLSPGQQLPPERELAKQFEVSRPSIREQRSHTTLGSQTLAYPPSRWRYIR